MTIEVRLDRQSNPIELKVFTQLLDNSVAGTYAAYTNALEDGYISFKNLVFLARKGDIPYTLFFAPSEVVESQVNTKTEKLLAGLSKETFSVNSRDVVALRNVELILKDLIRKQELLKKYDKSLQRNRIVGILRKPSKSPEVDAERLMTALHLSHEDLKTVRTKQAALELMIDRLESKQILVSRSVPNYMPQRLVKVQFSGMTVRDNKVPYIFLAGGEHGDHQEPVGRTIFTLALLTVLVARRIFAPMTWNGGRIEVNVAREYDIVGAMLMPSADLREIMPSSIEDMKIAADRFKVTPSAVTVRSMRLGVIDPETAQSHLDELRKEFIQPDQGPRNKIRPENAVRKYNGREFSSRMLEIFDSGDMKSGEFYRTVCLNRLKPHQLGNLREALA